MFEIILTVVVIGFGCKIVEGLHAIVKELREIKKKL